MKVRRKRRKFRLEEIASFDARRGYRRCALPGVGCTPGVHPWLPVRPIHCTADFWRNRTGGVVVRFFSTQPYTFHFAASLSDGKQIPDEDLEEFGDYISEMLLDWGGADDAPDPDVEY